MPLIAAWAVTLSSGLADESITAGEDQQYLGQNNTNLFIM
jgi:hypothetical protein